MAQVPAIQRNKPAVQRNRKYTFFTDVAKNPISYLMGLPVIVYTFIFGYCTYPYVISAFQQYKFSLGLLHSPFVGFKNFEFFFKSSQVFTVTLTTLELNLLFLIFRTLFAVVLALTLNELRSKPFLRITQSMMLFPNYLSWVVVSYMIYSLFSTNYGLINEILKAFGLEPVSWYNDARPWKAILTGMNVWKEAGINAVIFIAAITGIDITYYEAAKIDSASRWQMCWRITLPLLFPTIAIMTLLSVGRLMYGNFQMLYAIIGNNGILLSTTDVIDTYVVRALRQYGDPSNAMAVSLFQSLVGFAMVYGCNMLVRKYSNEAALF